jgi:serine/threonine protein kinase
VAERTAAAGRFGRFWLRRRIALGGMAEIWLAAERIEDARGRRLMRDVVIKRILPHFAEDPDFVAYFVNEGSIGTRLDHPNVIRTFELGQLDGQYYLAMEYVRGQSLLDVLRRAGRARLQLSAAFAIDVVEQAARGLAYAHAACDEQGRPLGIVHRDVSPHNLLLGFDGRVKVLDFGVAKAKTQLHHTRTGTIKGKLSYVAPEQIAGRPVDARTDVFALGIVLHETLAGRPLFKAANEAETLARVIGGTIPALSQLRPDCPPELDRIARTALVRDPARRFESAASLADELSRLRSFLPDASDVVVQTLSDLFPDEVAREDPRPPTGSWRGQQAGSPRPPRRRALLSQVAVAVGAAAAVAGLLTLEQRTVPPGQARAADRGIGAGSGGGAATTQPWSVWTPSASAPPEPFGPLAEPGAAGPFGNRPTPAEVRPTPPAVSVRAVEPRPPAAHLSHVAAPVAPAAPGRLRVIVQPWAEVTVDGREIGLTPVPAVALPAGPHQVTLHNGELGREVRRRVVVPAGGEAVLRIDLFHAP